VFLSEFRNSDKYVKTTMTATEFRR